MKLVVGLVAVAIGLGIYIAILRVCRADASSVVGCTYLSVGMLIGIGLGYWFRGDD